MKVEYSGGNIGFCTILFITFLVLKLTHVIDWSWWWITAPLWGPFAAVIAVLAIIAVILILVAIINVIIDLI